MVEITSMIFPMLVDLAIVFLTVLAFKNLRAGSGGLVPAAVHKESIGHKLGFGAVVLVLLIFIDRKLFGYFPHPPVAEMVLWGVILFEAAMISAFTLGNHPAVSPILTGGFEIAFFLYLLFAPSLWGFR
jgi:hypothetical protein